MKIQEIVIKPNKSLELINILELYRYRELFYIFVWRDIKVRYKQTLLGISWVILQPIINTIIFTFFFGFLAKISSGNLPYTIFVLSGLVFWTYFSSAFSRASDSMLSNENIIKKVYFPKIILPLSFIITSFLDFLINFLILLVLSFLLRMAPSLWLFVILPIGILMAALTAAGLGMFFASLKVKYRDVNYILPFLIQTLFYLTPVIYPLSILSIRHRIILAFNPMTSVIEGIRWAFSGSTVLTPLHIAISFIVSLLIFLSGLVFFQKTEQYFTDIV